MINLDVFLQNLGSLKQHPIIKMSGIDTIVNFTQWAGIGGPILDIADADLVSCFSQNLISSWRSVKYFFPLLKKGGRIINIVNEAGYVFSITAFNTLYSACDISMETFSSSLRQELYSSEIDVVTFSAGQFVVPRKFVDRHVKVTQRYIKPDGRWNKQIATNIKLVQEYCQPTTHGGFAVPLHVFCSSLYCAIHAVYPRRRYICNLSIPMRLGALLPESVFNFLLQKVIFDT